MRWYLFNPEHDMALASYSPYYKAPAEIIRMRNDLSGLPAWFAGKGDVACVRDAEYVDAFGRQCAADGIVPYGRCVWDADWVGMNGSDTVSSDVDYLFCPWGWDPALVQSLVKSGSDTGPLPDADRLQRIRELSGRQQCVRVLEDFCGVAGICGEALICTSLEQVHAFLSSHADVILKAPWSGSGRGLTRTSLSTWTANLEGWVARILRTQGAIMAEPIYNKVYDFAMEFCMESNHQLCFAGYSLFETDSHGNYKENVLASNEQIVQKLTQYVSRENLDQVKQQLLVTLSGLLGSDYTGYFGVDMMICREDDPECGTVYLIHPCVEINLRMNMGVVARLIYDRYVDARATGSYVVEHYNSDGEALEHDLLLRESYPVRVEEGKMVEGYFSLTPVTSDTRYQCYVLCRLME